MASTMRGMARGYAQEKQIETDPVPTVAIDVPALMTPEVSLEPLVAAEPVSIELINETTPEPILEAATPTPITDAVVETLPEHAIIPAELAQPTAPEAITEKKGKTKPPSKKSGKSTDQKKVITPKVET